MAAEEWRNTLTVSVSEWKDPLLISDRTSELESGEARKDSLGHQMDDPKTTAGTGCDVRRPSWLPTFCRAGVVRRGDSLQKKTLFSTPLSFVCWAIRCAFSWDALFCDLFVRLWCAVVITSSQVRYQEVHLHCFVRTRRVFRSTYWPNARSGISKRAQGS